MLCNILSPTIYNIIDKKLNYNKLCEIRLRVGSPAVVLYGGQFLYLTADGASPNGTHAIVCDKRAIEGIIQRACEYSVYAYTAQLRQGFITVSGGIRIGVAGEVVVENNSVITIKNFAAINIRLPHEVVGQNTVLINKLISPPASTLIVSPPGAGKTTLLREISRSLSTNKTGKIYSTLILDERNEIAAANNAIPSLNVGKFTDIISGGTKEYGFTAAIRAMRPDIIITDELSGEKDALAVSDARASGIVVFASVHGKNAAEIRQRKSLKSLIENRTFDYYVTLSDRNGIGTVEGLLDGDFNLCQY